MRVLTCLTTDHNMVLVFLAALLCVLGSSITIRLAHRAIHSRGRTAMHWLFLAAVCSGFSIWATHFIAMLGYRPGVDVGFDATLTIVSALIAIAGTAIGFAFARLRDARLAVICGGSMTGLAISAMHYVGMFAYRPDGIVRWTPAYVALSVAAAIALSALAIDRLRSKSEQAPSQAWDAVLPLVAAILLLHFIGMAAFEVIPIAGFSRGAESDVFSAMASAIAIAALIIVGTGVSAHLVEEGRAEANEYLRRIAMLDMLTGLANRHSFVTRLEEECRQLARSGRPFALFMIDLDRFKAVNDTLGHAAGDLLLKLAAERLQKVAVAQAAIARIGGDEFALLAPGIASRREVERLAREIVAVLSDPFSLDGVAARVGASVGVTLAPFDSSDPEILSQQADAALYRAKRSGRGRAFMFDPSFRQPDLVTRALLPKCGIDRRALELL